IARRACSRSRPSSPSFWKPSDESVKTVWTRTSETLSFLSSSSSRAARSSSSANALLRPHLLGVDLLQARAILVARELALARVRGGHGQPLRDAELLGDRVHPFEQALQLGAGRAHLERREVDQRAGEAVADRPPEVLLDPAMRPVRERFSLVDCAGDPGGERVAERRGRLGLAEVGLRVADPDLHRREGEVRPDAPPELRVLVDRGGLVETPDVALEPGPALVRVRDSAAREHAREDLRARRVEARVDVLD